MLFRVTSFAFDPASGTVFYTNDNLALRDLMAVDVKTGEERMLFENARIGEIVVQPGRPFALGVRHENGLATLVRLPPPYDVWYRGPRFPYEFVPYDLDISPDGRLLSAAMSEVNGDQFLRVWEIAKLQAGDLKPLSEFRFGQSVPESFVFSRDGRYLYGSSYYTGVSNIFRYEVATGASRPFRMPNPAFSGRCRSPTAGSSFWPIRAKASFPRPSIRARSRTSAPSSSWARRSPRSTPSSRRGRCRRRAPSTTKS